MKNGPKILVLDIETSPSLAHVWSLWNQNVGLNQLMEPGEVIAFAASWVDRRGVEFYSDHHDGHKAMVKNAWRLLDEADIVVHYNGTKFDIPWLRSEFLRAGMDPPSPFKEVDLFRVVKSRFKFASNRLDHVVRELGLGGKVSHTGHELWVLCMAGDEKAWRMMRRYNIGDVRITKALYLKLLPWITGHPSVGLWSGEPGACPRCGSTSMQSRGSAYTPTGVFQQLRCNSCGSWSRGNKRIGSVDTRGLG